MEKERLQSEKNLFVVDLTHVMKSLWEKAWVLILITLMGGCIGFSIANFAIAPKYSSSVMLYVNNSSLSSGNISVSEISAAQSLVKTYSVILNNRTTLEKVIESLSLDYTYEELSDMITSESVSETEIMRVSITSEDPNEAAEIANCIAEILPERINDIIKASSVEVVDSAVANPKMASPNPLKYTAVGMILGFLLIFAYIFFRVIFDDTVHDENYFSETYTYPMLGVISDFNNTEQYRRLRANLKFVLQENEECPVIGITSSMRGEEKGRTAVNLARAIAESGKKVLLIDGDLRASEIAAEMKTINKPGLSDLLIGEKSYKISSFKSRIYDNWYAIPSGTRVSNPSELLDSKRMKNLLKVFSQKFNYIIINLPPVNVFSDTVAVSEMISGMILVIKENCTTKKELSACVNQMKFAEFKLLGAVMNKEKPKLKKKIRFEENGRKSF